MYFFHQTVLPKYKLGMLFLFFVAQLVIFTTNVVTWQESLRFQGIASHVAPSDVELANFLKTHYAKMNVLLISDPTTSYILEPLTGINSPGGAYMNTQNRIHIASLINTPDVSSLNTTITAIQDRLVTSPVDGYLLVLSARYFQWTDLTQTKQLSFAFNIWRPQSMALDDTIAVSTFEKTMNMQPIFTDGSATVLYIGRTSL